MSIFTVFLKNKNIIFKIKRSKVTDYAALTMVLRKQNFDPNGHHLMCGVFAMLFDKSRCLIELFTQNTSALVPGGFPLVYRKGSLKPDENFSLRVLVNQVT